MITRTLIKRDPETYVVCADTVEDAFRDNVLPTVGEIYDKFKCVSLDATRCHNLPHTFVVVVRYDVQIPEEYFMRIGDPAT